MKLTSRLSGSLVGIFLTFTLTVSKPLRATEEDELDGMLSFVRSPRSHLHQGYLRIPAAFEGDTTTLEAGHNFEGGSRQKRSTGVASTKSEKRRRTGKKSRGAASALAGNVVFSARRAFRIYFDFDYASLSQSDIFSAHVLVYHSRSRRREGKRRTTRSVATDSDVGDVRTPVVAQRERRSRRNRKSSSDDDAMDRSARVIMHQTIDFGDEFGSTHTTDMKLIPAKSRGWVAFDITDAVKDWVAEPDSNHGLELWVVSSRPGRRAALTASRMRFVKPNSRRLSLRPELVVKLKPAVDSIANLTT